MDDTNNFAPYKQCLTNKVLQYLGAPGKHIGWVGGSNTCWVVRASRCLCKVTKCRWGGSKINKPARGWGLIHLQLPPTRMNGGWKPYGGWGRTHFLLDCLALAFTQTCSTINKVINMIFKECDPWGWLMIPKHLNKLNFTIDTCRLVSILTYLSEIYFPQ